MNESRRAWFCAVALLGSLFATVSSSAGDTGFSASLDGRYMAAWPSGSIEITQGGQPGSGSKINLSRDLDLGVGQIGGGGGEIALGRHGLALFYEPFFFDGQVALDRAVTFHGSTYPAGTQVSSHVGFDLWRIGYDYAVQTKPTQPLRVGLRLLIWDFDARLQGNGVNEQRSFSSVLPEAVVSGGFAIGPALLTADLAGGIIGSNRYSFEIAGGVGWRPYSWLRVDGGARVFSLAFEQTTNRGDLTAYGPFVSLSILFNSESQSGS